MLTRLKVTGFKNLVDLEIQFGPFTCVAGANGVGKSNLFDAIGFLCALADHTLVDAALSIREESRREEPRRTTDVLSLFHRLGDRHDKEMAFEAEMVIPSEGTDDLGQQAEAGTTFLRYAITLAYRDEDGHIPGALEILKEELQHINITDVKKYIQFPFAKTWRDSAVRGRRTSPLISTEGEGPNRVIKLHQDGTKGRPLGRLAARLPRTVLSVTNAAESPTALLARKEMRSWRRLQLEPSALRKPDEFTAPPRLEADGSHLPAALYHLARYGNDSNGIGVSREDSSARVYSQLANRLAELIDDAKAVSIDLDEKRELLTLQVKGHDGTTDPARALSDGTLRFLALAVLELDPEANGLICMEEPENGIHPERIPAMLRLLRDIAVDTDEPIGPDNPLRQVIINTHSPAVVGEVPEDSLLIAELRESIDPDGARFKRLEFSCLPQTWRLLPEVSKGKLLSYLQPISPVDTQSEPDMVADDDGQTPSRHRTARRVADRPDLQPFLPFADRTL
ncbi:MAG TPA: AAA family ATPase [Blastocatellia bacterium]